MTNLGEDVLNRLGIIGDTVTLGTLGADADEVGRRVVDVLRVSLLEDTSSRVQEVAGLLDRSNVSGGVGRGSVGAVVDVTHGPGVDGEGSTVSEGGSAVDADGDRDVRELDVVEDDRAVELAVRVLAHAHEDGGVGDNGVDDGDSLDTLVAGWVDAAGVGEGDVDTDLGVVDGDALEGEAPVPDDVDLRDER